MLTFSVSLRPISLWLSETPESGASDDQKTRANRWLSKLFNILVLVLVEGIFMPLNRQRFSTPTFMNILANER